MAVPHVLGHVKYLKDVDIDGAVISGPVTLHDNLIFGGAGPQSIILNQPVYVTAGASDIFDLSNVQSSAFNLQPRSSIPTNNPPGSKRLWYGNSVATPVAAQNRFMIENNVIAYISDIIAAFTDATLKGDTRITGGGPGLNQLTVLVPSTFSGNITATNNGSTYTFHSVILQPRASNPVVSTTDLWYNTSAPLQPGLFLGNKLIPAQEVLSMNWTLINPASPSYTALMPVVVTKTGTTVRVEWALNDSIGFTWIDTGTYTVGQYPRLQPTGLPTTWMPLSNAPIPPALAGYIFSSATGLSYGAGTYTWASDCALAWVQASTSWGFASIRTQAQFVEAFNNIPPVPPFTGQYFYNTIQFMPTSWTYSTQPYL